MKNDGEIRAEIDKIQADESKGFGLFWRKITRIFIRSLRITCGLAFLGLAAWPGTSAWDTLGTPFAQQSALGVLGGLFLAALAWWLIRVAFSIAFGAGPTEDEEFERQRRMAADIVNANRESMMQTAMRMAPKPDDAAVSYALGKYMSKISRRK